MKFRTGARLPAVLWLSVLLLASCGLRKMAPTAQRQGTPSGVPTTAQEAARATYHYAFSGQIVDSKSKKALSKFSVALANEDRSVNSVINALGNSNGIFHISRTGSSSTSLPLLISAPGFQPQVATVPVGADCQSTDCSGETPLSIALDPIVPLVSDPNSSQPPADSFSPSAVTQDLATNGAPALFQKLIANGKLDSTTQNLLSGAKKGDVLNGILVMLNGNGNSQAGDITSSLLSGVQSGGLNSLLAGFGGQNGLTNLLQGSNAAQALSSVLSAILAAKTGGIGPALLGANGLIGYLLPLLQNGTTTASGPFGQLLAGLLNGVTASGGDLSGLLAMFKNFGGKNGAQLAMSTFLPLFQGILTGANKTGKTSPFADLLQGALKDGGLFSQLLNGGLSKDKGLNLLLTYVQPLLQGMSGSNGSRDLRPVQRAAPERRHRRVEKLPGLGGWPGSLCHPATLHRRVGPGVERL